MLLLRNVSKRLGLGLILWHDPPYFQAVIPPASVDSSCRGDRDPLNMVQFAYELRVSLSYNVKSCLSAFVIDFDTNSENNLLAGHNANRGPESARGPEVAYSWSGV
jgi:hypothetical protein